MDIKHRGRKMYSKMGIYQKENINYKNNTMLPILTIGILIIIISFVVIARGLFNTRYEGGSIPAQSSNSIISDETNLNASEREVLTMISSVIKLPDQIDQGNNIYYIYYPTLLKYLSNSEVYLTSNQAQQVRDKIISMHEIMSYEGETDFAKMSLDGRKVFIYLSEQIYELCGLKTVSTMEGDIEKISDVSGNIVYAKKTPVSQVGLQVNALIIIVATMVTLLIICIIIAKKNQLFIKEVIYDGFDKERFA